MRSCKSSTVPKHCMTDRRCSAGSAMKSPSKRMAPFVHLHLFPLFFFPSFFFRFSSDPLFFVVDGCCAVISDRHSHEELHQVRGRQENRAQHREELCGSHLLFQRYCHVHVLAQEKIFKVFLLQVALHRRQYSCHPRRRSVPSLFFFSLLL